MMRGLNRSGRKSSGHEIFCACRWREVGFVLSSLAEIGIGSLGSLHPSLRVRWKWKLV